MWVPRAPVPSRLPNWFLFFLSFGQRTHAQLTNLMIQLFMNVTALTRHDTAFLALRLAAVYAWLQALAFLASGAIGFLFVQSETFGAGLQQAIFAFVLPSAALTLAGLFLWLRAPALARHFAGTEPEAVSGEASAAALAFAVVGLAVFLYALPGVINECIRGLQSEQFRHGYAANEFLQRLPALGASAIQLICGFVLFVRPHKLARWWLRRGAADVSA